MPRDEVFDTLSLEIATRQRFSIKKNVRDKIPELVPKPGAIGDWESDLLPIQDLLWHSSVERPFCQILCLKTSDFHTLRQPGGKLQEFVVEQWNPQLDGSGH